MMAELEFQHSVEYANAKLELKVAKHERKWSPIFQFTDSQPQQAM